MKNDQGQCHFMIFLIWIGFFWIVFVITVIYANPYIDNTLRMEDMKFMKNYNSMTRDVGALRHVLVYCSQSFSGGSLYLMVN